LKDSIVSGMRSVGRRPPFSLLLFHPDVRRSLQLLPGFDVIYGNGWGLTHPFDTLNGTETSGYIPPEQLPNSPFSDSRSHVYAGSQPSIVRAALRELPPLSNFTFIDLGAGKGRTLIVASEFPFQEVVGVELSSPLVAMAQKNLTTFRRQHPNCAPARIENGDAAVFPLPAGDLVIFLYNPFGEAVMRMVVTNMEVALRAERRRLFVVYYNPVYGASLDASPWLRRYYAGTISYAADESGFGPDDADPVVIWQGGSTLACKAGADAAIRVTMPGIRAELDPRVFSAGMRPSSEGRIVG